MLIADFENLLEYARIGIRRSSLFMGLAVRTAACEAIKTYDLSVDTSLRIFPDTDDASLLAEYKEEFRDWVVANALRELHEGFTEYLEKLNQACLTLGCSLGAYTPEECDRYHKRFHKDGLPDKFKSLRQRFSVSTKQEQGLLSLNDARNCLTHRRGIVGPEDFNDGDALHLRWRALEIYFVPKDGEPVLNRDIPAGGLSMPGGAIESSYVEQSCRFRKGDVLVFSPLQLSEICFFADEAATELAHSAVEFAQSKGVEVRERPPERADG